MTLQRLTARNRIIKRSLGVAALLLLIYFLLFYTPIIDVLFFDQPFSLETWRDGNFRQRGLMARSLIKSELLNGKVAPELMHLLGIPNRVEGGTYQYYVADRWWNPESLRSLTITLGKSGPLNVGIE